MNTTSEPATTDLAIDLARLPTSLDAARMGVDVIDAVKRNIGDTLSCALAGSSAEGIDIVSDIRPGVGWHGGADVVLGGRVPAHHAAWINSAMCHARDYDDTHDAAMLHAGVSSVPAAIAAAQLRGECRAPTSSPRSRPASK